MNDFEARFDQWLAEEHRLGRLHRKSSRDVYTAMWGALAHWCLGQDPPIRQLEALDAQALARFIQSREASLPDGESLTPRYEWRLISLVRRVQTWAAAAPRGHTSADALLAERPHVRLANVQRASEQIDHLAGAQVRALLRVMGRQHRLSRRGQLARWQDLRNVTAAALQLGAGLGPGDVRALTCSDVDPVRWRRPLRHAMAGAGLAWPDETPPGAGLTVEAHAGVPRVLLRQWIRVPANGNAPTHEAPVAEWAARLLSAWLELRQQLGIPGPWLLPSTRTGKPWGKVAQYQAGCEVLSLAGVPAKAAGGSFRLRHSFALRQLQRGHAADTVATWLGVTDPAVMQRYQRWLQHIVTLDD